jgi:hypothetical protein
MWTLFGTSYATVENEPQVYFIGIFDNFNLVNQEKNKLILQNKAKSYDYFIKEVKLNNIYDIDWSNSDNV